MAKSTDRPANHASSASSTSSEKETTGSGLFPQHLETGTSSEAVITADNINNPIFDKFSPWRKRCIVAFLTVTCFMAMWSATAVLPATPEIAADFQTTGTVISVCNGLYMLFLGMSSVVWGPFSRVFGRRIALITVTAMVMLASVGTGASPKLACFYLFRIITSIGCMGFLIIGPACIGDIYKPTDRGTATGVYQSGAYVGSAIGPLIGGIIVAHSQWRVIYWLQASLAAGLLLAIVLFFPETIAQRTLDLVRHQPRMYREIMSSLNPIRPLKLFRYPTMIMVAITSGATIWNMYALFTPIRYVVTTLLGLKQPRTTGIICLGPGFGYVFGGMIGGPLSDMVAKRFLQRTGKFIPEQRLWTVLPFLGVLMPACILFYGWALQTGIGGVPLAVVLMVAQCLASQCAFPAVVAYCIDSMPQNGAEAVAANFFARYIFACVASGVALPMIQSAGIGWFCTLSAVVVFVGALASAATIYYGKNWREAVDRQLAARSAATP